MIPVSQTWVVQSAFVGLTAAGTTGVTFALRCSGPDQQAFEACFARPASTHRNKPVQPEQAIVPSVFRRVNLCMISNTRKLAKVHCTTHGDKKPMNNDNQAPGHEPRGSGSGRRGGGRGNWRARGNAQAPDECQADSNPQYQNRGAGVYYRPPKNLQGFAGEQGYNRQRSESFCPRQNQEHRNYNRDGNMRNYCYQRNRQGDHRYDRNYSRNKNHNEQCMTIKTLEEIAQCDRQDVIAKVNEKKTSFLNLLTSANTDNGDVYVLIMEIIHKVCQSTFDELKLKLLLDICNTQFVQNLSHYVMNLPYIKASNNLYWNNQNGFWNNFVVFCQSIIEILPTIALNKFRSLIEDMSKVCLEKLKDKHGFASADEYDTILQQLRERLTIHETEDAEKESRKKTLPFVEDPPDDFRQLSVLPTRDDLLDLKAFLRPNIINGGYQDTEHYLDVQFRLLREDCFGPLRDGITEFIQNPNKNKYDNIRVYQNVKFVEPFISKNKIGETIQLDQKAMRRFKKITWAHSKRFIYGSLLLFTNDNCNSFITATVLERDIELLNQGKIPVSIVDKVAGENIYNDDSSYTMIESEVYFEPFLHVLKALQDPKFPEHIAMSKYIVRVDPVPNPPAYLTPETEFLVDRENSATEFKVLSPSTWPSKDVLGLNESQYAAYTLALTHEFAVIQGPPGTGKTYLGVQVAKTFIENLPSIDEKSSCLMLVICYTNHALDQFLELILSVTRSVVRIGGQSRNEAMEKIGISTLRKKRSVHFDTERLFFEQKTNLTLAVSVLKQAQKSLEYINNGVISFKSLKDHVPAVQTLGNYYAQYRQDVNTDPLNHWLFEHRIYKDFNNVMTKENIAIAKLYNDECNSIDVDEDNKRNEKIVFDEFEIEIGDPNNADLDMTQKISISFSINDIENKLKTMILLYLTTQSRRQQQKLQEEMIDLKSQADLFTEMIGNRFRQTQLDINNVMNLSTVSMADRWALYFGWANVVVTKLKQQMKPLQKNLVSANTAYEEARMMVDLKILRGVKVVGMTTSGAARLRKLLKALAPRIVIVEEAAEVLEQHIVTSLTKDCQHLILIGDHQQLRPSAAHNKLARDFNMEISLFERMITNGIHSRTLEVQHRMRPEIAALISPHIYPDLRNHPSVLQFPNVRGMTDNLFFLTHNFMEEDVDDSSSKSNQIEADMTLMLANYLMQQGYEPEDITVLAAYSGQMFYMRKQRGKYSHLEKVKITVVDNYQGEESKIILLSLVRNNNQEKIGFLGIENRVCVALSRARQGFYILGNIDILKKNSELWKKIAETLEKSGSVGTALMLKCENHSDQITTISSPTDFSKVPEGGCLLKCNYEMPCGHRCTLACHGYDRGHVDTKCYVPCERVLCELGHKCPSYCSVNCQPCMKMVENSLPCGHKKLLYCFLDPADPTIRCRTIVTVKLPKCDHEVEKACYMPVEEVKCPVRCIYRVDQCGHECTLNCHVSNDPHHENYICNKPCAKAKQGCTAGLAAGDRGNHQCTKLCHEPCEGCTVELTKKRSTCKHSERVACNKNVDGTPCRKNCARMLPCDHFCKKKCYEPCGDCKQMVTKTIPDCNHKIKLICMSPATRELCREKCERTLACGHACTKRCGQICDPTKCTELHEAEFESPCGHSVTIPCNVYNSMVKEWKPEVLLDYCTQTCGMELACEHFCKGTCGSCHQGRLHLACQDKCNRAQICGHLCNEPCNQVCPPCNRICEIKCVHSHCNKACGAPCKPCQEPCERRCRHGGACKRLCGDPCTRPPCNEACTLRLPCGHRCRGLCGEPCVNICKDCRPDDFPRDFLGDEYEDDIKFIRLQDCTHVFDVEIMDNLMMGDSEIISIPSCPTCRAPIINTQRYKDLVNHIFKTKINPIKEQVYGNEDIIKRKQEELYTKVLEFSGKYNAVLKENPEYKQALIKLRTLVKTISMKKRMLTPLPKLETYLQYLEILDMIGECDEKYREAKLKTLATQHAKLIKLICDALIANIHKISQQLQQDIANELKRMNSIIQLEKIFNHTIYLTLKTEPNVKQAAETAMQVVLSSRKFEQDAAVTVLKQLQEAVKVKVDVAQERALIIKAIGGKAGSWYKCPNGHFYSIDQCGGAMEVSKCADCGVPIGGQNHSLLPSNAHAGELDGSRFAAWSNEYNNMANWQI